ncbi:MAG: NAD(P)-dependent oxidoreductase [Chloroflexota bacterium]|nr:NAD(P)-dependent oxidoreductase [Chloroflexota bacterium]
MRVLVTGGSGRLGRWVVRELAQAGHDVVSADQAPPSRGGGEEMFRARRFVRVNMADVGQVAGALTGCDAVVHLAAIPAPYGHPDEVVFSNNTGATFAVLQAASLLGVRRAVIASSISALGMAWSEEPFFPLYAPVDEEHPLLGRDPYALSKEVDERTAEMFHRRTGMTVLAYRFHWIALEEEAVQQAERLRERPEEWAYQMWGYVDVRDAARACRLGLESEVQGFEVLNIIAADTLASHPTEELIRAYCSGTELRQPIEGTATAWSIQKARRLLGYEPQHSWRPDRPVET